MLLLVGLSFNSWFPLTKQFEDDDEELEEVVEQVEVGWLTGNIYLLLLQLLQFLQEVKLSVLLPPPQLLQKLLLKLLFLLI